MVSEGFSQKYIYEEPRSLWLIQSTSFIMVFMWPNNCYRLIKVCYTFGFSVIAYMKSLFETSLGKCYRFYKCLH